MTLSEIALQETIHIKSMCDITKTLMNINAMEGTRAMLYVTGTCVNSYLQSWSDNPRGHSDRDTLNGVDKIKQLYAQCVAEFHLRYDYRGC